MTTYLGDKAVGIGTVKAEIGVTGIVLHDDTLVGNGNTEPLGVNTANIVSQQTLANTVSVLNTAIDAQADAIAKTRNDMNEKDSELESILNEHAEELTNLRGNQASLGDQVSNIESKIPQSASDNNPLITKQQLLDEEMDIRDDYNELVSELQTQITAQASAIAGKQDKLTAGENIIIENGVISATGGGGELPDNVLVNKPNGEKSSLVITPDYNGNYGAYNIAIGAGVVDSRNYSVHIGYDSLDSTTTGCSVGIGSKTRTAAFSVAIGYDAEAIAQYSIQIGGGENKDANTFKVANSNGNFEMMSADGTIPLERLTKVTDQIGDISTALTAILGE